MKDDFWIFDEEEMNDSAMEIAQEERVPLFEPLAESKDKEAREPAFEESWRQIYERNMPMVLDDWEEEQKAKKRVRDKERAERRIFITSEDDSCDPFDPNLWDPEGPLV